jgi:hypothetical protein
MLVRQLSQNFIFSIINMSRKELLKAIDEIQYLSSLANGDEGYGDMEPLGDIDSCDEEHEQEMMGGVRRRRMRGYGLVSSPAAFGYGSMVAGMYSPVAGYGCMMPGGKGVKGMRKGIRKRPRAGLGIGALATQANKLAETYLLSRAQYKYEPKGQRVQDKITIINKLVSQGTVPAHVGVYLVDKIHNASRLGDAFKHNLRPRMPGSRGTHSLNRGLSRLKAAGGRRRRRRVMY